MTDSTSTQRRADGSANAALLQAVWLKANERSEPICIPCGSKADRVRLRNQLYNAVRNAKKFPEQYPVLWEATQNCELVPDPHDETKLIVRRKALAPAMQGLRGVLSTLGVEIAEEDLAGTPQIREERAASSRLMTSFGLDIASPPSPSTPEPTAPRVANPFYTRG